ncbi:MAG: PHP domain-containing protein [Chloroflexi bacterium]|nr:PHP domain-containing protein [Chloroflexota bacterium]
MPALPDPMTDDRYVDLHLHTTRSDGRWEPRRVVEEAVTRGLTAISITDHDVLSGLAEAAEAAAEHGIALLPGVELTADWDGRTVHVLGYGIDPADPGLVAALERGRALMAEHVEDVLRALAEAGTPIAAEDLERYRVRYANGAALVLAMVQHGVLRRTSEGGRLLRLASREPRAYTAVEAIALVRGAGGVSALAHPAKILRNRPLLDAIDLRPLADAGLDGLEVWQIVHGASERAHYAAVAETLGLVPVGGSDCHGPRTSYGPRIGSQHVPYSVYARLLDALAA